MPHRVMTVDEAAAYLHLPAARLTELARASELPCETRPGGPVFRRRDLDAWASQHILGMSRRNLVAYHQAAAHHVHRLSRRHALMPDLITADRIAPALPSRTKPSALRDMAELADRTGLVGDLDGLRTSLDERERLCSTALAEGVALLHPRHHDPYLFLDSFIVLGRLSHPIHAGSQDGKPTDLLFLVCCQDDRLHLHTLARLCTMFMEANLPARLRAAADADAMAAAIIAAEHAILPPRQTEGAPTGAAAKNRPHH